MTGDELDLRVRALQAERMRPVPALPKRELELAADSLLRRLKATYEPPNEDQGDET